MHNTLKHLHDVDEIGRLETLFKVSTEGLPQHIAGTTYFLKRDIGEEIHVLVATKDSMLKERRVICDPVRFTRTETASIRNFFVAPNGLHVICEISVHHNDTVSLEIFETHTGVHVDSIPNAVFPRKPCWFADSTGFYYARCGLENPTQATGKFHRHIFAHTLGTVHTVDSRIFGETLHEEHAPSIAVTSDGAFEVTTVNIDTTPRRTQDIYIRKKGGSWRCVFKGATHAYAESYTRTHEGTLFIYTNYQAPNWRVRAIPAQTAYNARSLDSAHDVLPEQTDVLESYSVNAQTVVGEYAHVMSGRLEVYAHDGTHRYTHALPEHSTVAGFGTTHTGVCVALTSFHTRLQLVTLTDERMHHLHDSTPPAVSAIETKLFYARSPDGTRVPYFVVRSCEQRIDGHRPTLIYGYGGFNYSTRPAFRPYAIAFLQAGGVFVLPALRGGKEFGELWHRAGMHENKQNVFEDCYAVVRDVIKRGYTHEKHVALGGWSNGGLLSAVALTQHPELFGAVCVGAPVTNMTTFHTHEDGGRRWQSELGRPDDPRNRTFLSAYDPLCHVTPQVYPATYITTATHDDRVMPAHASSFHDALSKSQQGTQPIVLNTQPCVGHTGSPRKTNRIAFEAEMLSFVLDNTSRCE